MNESGRFCTVGIPRQNTSSSCLTGYKRVFGMGIYLCVTLLGLDLIAYLLGGNTAVIGVAIVAFLVPVVIMSSYTLTHIEKDGTPSAHH